MAGLAESIREQGLAATQISDIVRHARASRATFYRCFEDKDACFAALAEEKLESTLTHVARAIDLEAPAERQVDQMIESFLEVLEEDRAVSVTLSGDLQMLGARGAQIRNESIEKYAQFVLVLVHNPNVAAEMGPLSHMTLEKSIMLICGIVGLLDRAAARNEDVRLLAPEIKAVVKRVLAPTAAGTPPPRE